MLIILVGFELFKTSIAKIGDGSVSVVNNLTLILLGVAILVKVWLFFFYRKIAKITTGKV